jgi:hypothetical protein
VILLALISTVLAKGHAISGQILDRNGKPLERVNVSLTPGNVEIITDENGMFRIDYLRDEEGNRIKLARRTSYALTLFKVGYHEESAVVEFRRGELVVEAITLEQETIRVESSGDDIDPSKAGDSSQSAGGSYEGE